MKRIIILFVVLLPFLHGCTNISVPSAFVYRFPENLYAGKVHFVKIGVKNAFGFLIANTTIKVNDVDYTTDDSGYATVPIYFAESGTKQITVQSGLVEETKQLQLKKPSWFIFLWICSDNNLDTYVQTDLQEIVKAADDVSVAILWDSREPSKDGLYILTDLRTIYKIEPSGEINSGDGDLLKSFTERFSSLDSDRKALIIWNHGLSWIDIPPSDYSTKGISYDDQSKDFLTIDEIAKNVKGSWDVFGMDACLMGSVEVIYALKEIADFILASPNDIPADGFDYGFLADVSNKSPVDFSKAAIDYYKNYYYSKSYATSLAVYETSRVDEAINSLNTFLSPLPQDLPNLSSITTYSSYFHLYDLGQVLEKMQATETLEKFNEVVVYRYLSEELPTSLGMSVFFPANKEDVTRLQYSSTQFAEDTLWDEFLLNH
ncbi:clostripain-related cysteine peptidase [Pseudothermotoga sp. U03pept]|uniref:clostripain-related cysteine peptidase n=1 Tax=Pseudothermotoga sp. U03pept TaxID=3447012 RepID=UPI003F059A34